MADNRICKVCGESYSYCPTCDRDSDKPTWMVMFHDENCKKIFIALQDNFLKKISDRDALKVIDSCDISKKDSFNDVVKNDLEKLLKKRITKDSKK